MGLHSIGTPGLWGGFTLFILLMVLLDLGVFHREPHVVSARESLLWLGIWVTLAFLFDLGMYIWSAPSHAFEFLAGYVIEKALSVDNLFVFIVIFSSFAVPDKYQHQVLSWGILGALVMRALFIFLGATLVQKYHWISYVFGAFLVYSGAQLLRKRGVTVNPQHNPLFRLFSRIVPSVEDYHSGRFTIVQAGRRYATPLLLVLAAIEISDILFAVDSVPAIFAVTQDPFIVFTSNIFAILGLRSLYFALARTIDRFHYLDIALSLILMFAGTKMLLRRVFEISTVASLAVISTLLGVAILSSALKHTYDTTSRAVLEPIKDNGTVKRAGAMSLPAIRRIVVTVIGFSVLCVGVAMIVLPGPAVVVIPLGLAILASEYAWARNLLQRLKSRTMRLIGRSTALIKKKR